MKITAIPLVYAGKRVSYAKAVTAGNLIFVSGFAGKDPVTGNRPEDVREQINIIMKKFENALEEAEASFDDVISLRIYTQNQNQLDLAVNEVKTYMPDLENKAVTTYFATHPTPGGGHVKAEILAAKEGLHIDAKIEAIKLPYATTGRLPSAGAAVFGDFVFVTDVEGIDPKTGKFVEGVGAQTEMALKNVEVILNQTGTSLDKIIRSTVSVTSRDDLLSAFDVIRRVLPKPGDKANCDLWVEGLREGSLVKIEAVAAK